MSHLKASGRCYLLWLGRISMLFLVIYPLCNWFADQQDYRVSLFLPFETNTPFIPEWIWIYFSLNVLFILPLFRLDPDQINLLGRQMFAATLVAAVIFLLLPAESLLLRSIPENEPYRQIFTLLYFLDRPNNLAPSLHVIYSGLILISIIRESGTSLRLLFGSWLVLILLSTLLVHQHQLVDVLLASVVIIGCRKLVVDESSTKNGLE
jgi:membrane-associated phospholipid phosphatase